MDEPQVATHPTEETEGRFHCGDHCRQSHSPTFELTAEEMKAGAAGGFGHPAEAFVAAILDQAGIRWEYEPRCFPISWDNNGQPNGYFCPDFYLVDEDRYIEVTVMEQANVTKKNRKLRLLRQHHPDVTCQILYRVDIGSLLARVDERPDLFIEGGRVFPKSGRRPQVRRLTGRGSN